MYITLLAAALTLAGAPQSSPCTAPEARAFDFWIGDWDIRQRILRTDGTWLELPARTSVTAALDGCALIEQWQGQVSFFWEGMQELEAMTGLSVRAYDPSTSKWFIHWMDTRAPRFGAPYVGTFVKGRGEFFRELETPEGRRVGRITFSGITADSVAWELAVSSDDRKTWQTLWTMEMQRRSPAVAQLARQQRRNLAEIGAQRHLQRGLVVVDPCRARGICARVEQQLDGFRMALAPQPCGERCSSR
jgi:hypothetical protein